MQNEGLIDLEYALETVELQPLKRLQDLMAPGERRAQGNLDFCADFTQRKSTYHPLDIVQPLLHQVGAGQWRSRQVVEGSEARFAFVPLSVSVRSVLHDIVAGTVRTNEPLVEAFFSQIHSEVLVGVGIWEEDGSERVDEAYLGISVKLLSRAQYMAIRCSVR